MLHSLTDVINSVALLVAFWLGLYLVTRSPHRPEAWLSALASWSIGGYFLNQLLALNPPPAPPPDTSAWLYHLMLFWPREVFELGWKGWLQGWLPAYSVMFWYHATLYVLPGAFTLKRLLSALPGYAVALAGILINVQYGNAWVNPFDDPLYISSSAFPYFPLIVIGYATFAGLSVINLARASRSSPASMPRTQFRMFIGAVFLAGCVGMLRVVSTSWDFPIPQAFAALLLLVTLLLAGIGIANRNALLDRRFLPRDLFYSAAGATAILAIYYLFLRIISGPYPLPEMSFALVGCLAVISHSLIDVARIKLDRLYLYNENHKLRLRLHEAFNLVGSKETNEVLCLALEALAGAVKAAWAVVLHESAQGMKVKLLASWNWTNVPLDGAVSSSAIGGLPADHLAVLKPRQLAPPLEKTAVAVPLPNQGHRSLLLVGPPRSRSYYTDADLEMMQDVGDFISSVILGRSPALNLLTPPNEQLAQTVDISLRTVELALRNLNNYAYLNDSPLSDLRLVVQRIKCQEGETVTLMDRGQAVSDVLAEAVQKLRPSQDDMPKPPSRAWYPYLILWDAYLEGKPNLEIMSRLYISEGTFNRTRKAAINSVVRILAEMEAQIK